MIDPRRLQVLIDVARHGSFNRAAAALRLTPSAVSQQVSALERTVGTAVVQRSTRGVELTDAGRILVETAEAISAELACAQQEIAKLAVARTERLTVTTFTSGGQRLLPPALIRFSAEHPEVELTVFESEPDDAIPLVRSGSADLALSYHFDGPPPVLPGDRSGLRWSPLVEDPMWVVLPAGHQLAGRTSVTIAELAGERWVHGCLEVGAVLEHYAAMAGYEMRVACRSTDYTFAQSLVRTGLGISVIPEIALTADRVGLGAARLAPPAPCRYVGVATAARRRPNPLVDDLMRILRETVTALPAMPLTRA